MAITFSDAVGQSGNSSTPTVSRTLPGSPATDDGSICIAVVACAGGPITAVPSGWTEILSQVFNTDDYLYAYWREHLGASEPASFQWTQTTSTRWATINASFKGVDITTPVDVFDKQANASSANVVAPGVDPNYLEDMLVFVGAAVGIGTWTAPTGFSGSGTDADLSKPAASLITAGLAFKLLSDGAATGDITGTISAAGVNAGGLIALKDASATPDSPDPADHPLAATAALPLVTVAALGNVPAPADTLVDHRTLYYNTLTRTVGRKLETP